MDESKCDHIYGICYGYPEQGGWCFSRIPMDNVDPHEIIEEFNYCPYCGLRIYWSEE